MTANEKYKSFSLLKAINVLINYLNQFLWCIKCNISKSKDIQNDTYKRWRNIKKIITRPWKRSTWPQREKVMQTLRDLAWQSAGGNRMVTQTLQDLAWQRYKRKLYGHTKLAWFCMTKIQEETGWSRKACATWRDKATELEGNCMVTQSLRDIAWHNYITVFWICP